MLNFNIHPNNLSHQYASLFYNPYFPVFNYCYQFPSEGFDLTLNTNSSLFYQEKQITDTTLVSHVSSDSQTVHHVEEQPQLIKKEKNALTEYVDRKNGEKKKKKIYRNDNKNRADQKQNRNVSSNILRNFFRKINDHSKIQKLVTSIISKNQLTLSSSQFFQHVKSLKINYGKYLRFKKLRHHFVDETHKQHSLVFRVLFQYMANGQLLIQSLTSRKIGRWSVPLHLKGARELKDRLYG